MWQRFFLRIKDFWRGNAPLFGSPLRTKECLKAMKEYKEAHPYCEATGTDKKVEPHHIYPVWMSPEKAADPNNFICLSTKVFGCNLHLLLGHNGDYVKGFNLFVREDAKRLRERILSRQKVGLSINEIYGKND